MKKAAEKFRQTTLGEQGFMLPIGKVTPDKKLVKQFSLRPYRMKEERALAEFKNKSKTRLTLGIYVSQMLATMLESVGGTDFNQLSESERRLYVAQMFLGDVMYAYVMLRREAMGEIVGMSLPCGTCRQRLEFEADLNTLDISVLDDAEQLTWAYTLKQPLVFSGAPRGKFKMQPALWSSLETKHSGDITGMRAAVICGSICGMEGIPEGQFAPVAEHFLDDMTKLDLERISSSIEYNSPGPKMGVEEQCPTCRTVMFWPIDWGTDSFFNGSSLRQT